MHGRIVLLFFLASGSLMSMQQGIQQEIWDESGNYLGLDQMPGRLVMVPAGYAAVLYPLSQAEYGFAFHPDGIPAASSNDQWVVGVEQLDDLAVSGPAALDEVLVENNFAPVASASAQHSSQNWADFDDDNDEPPSLPAGWVRLSSSAPNVPVPASPVPPQKKQLRSDAISLKDNRKKVTAHTASSHIDDDNDNDDTMIRGVDSVSDWRKRTPLNERLVVAAGGISNKQQIMGLFWRKITWLTKHCPKPLCQNECERFSQLLDARFSNFSVGPKEAQDLLQLAQYCMNSTNRCQYEGGKKGFARVAGRLICIAESSLEGVHRRIARQVYQDANSILSLQTTGGGLHE